MVSLYRSLPVFLRFRVRRGEEDTDLLSQGCRGSWGSVDRRRTDRARIFHGGSCRRRATVHSGRSLAPAYCAVSDGVTCSTSVYTGSLQSQGAMELLPASGWWRRQDIWSSLACCVVGQLCSVSFSFSNIWCFGALMRRKRPSSSIACSRTVRRRGSADHASAVTGDTSSCPAWASLHEDLVSLIGYRVLAGDLRDYIRFRAVCPHWRSSTARPRGRGVTDPRFHPRRWMMLPEGHGLYPGHGKMRGYIRFFNLSTGDFVRLRLPHFKDHCILDSMDGILMLHRDKDTAIRLLNPFTGDIEELPPLNTLVPYLDSAVIQLGRWEYLRNLRAASISASADGVVRVMISILGMQRIGFASSGDQRWNVSSWIVEDGPHPQSFQGKLYVIARPKFYGEPEISQIEPFQHEGTMNSTSMSSSVPSPPKLTAKCPATTRGDAYSYYMVDCDSEVLVVTLSLDDYRQCSVYRLTDLVLGRIVPMTSIGGNALFLGRKNLCVNSKAFPTLVGDTIVFSHRDQNYLAEYNLSTDTWSPIDGHATIGDLASPTSIFYHLHTCCFREQWNKGQIMYQDKARCWRVHRKWRAGT